MEPKRPDRRPAIVVGLEWAYRIIAMGMCVALPTWLGFWLDERWGLSPWLTLCGAGLGMAMFFLDVLRLAQGPRRSKSHNDETSTKP